MMKLDRETFEELIEGNLEWLKACTHFSVERSHIEQILRDAPRVYYEIERSHAALLALAQRVANYDPDRDDLAKCARAAIAAARSP